MIDAELERAIADNYRLWNDGKREELDDLFAAMGPNGFSIEYVGSAPVEGSAAMAAMWAEYGGKCTTQVQELIANGHEAAVYVHNHLQTADGVAVLPSLEVYKIEDGVLTIRYFHRTPH